MQSDKSVSSNSEKDPKGARGECRSEGEKKAARETTIIGQARREKFDKAGEEV